VTLHANSIARALYEMSSKVWKLRRERGRSLSTAVSTAGQTMTEPEVILAKYQQWRCVSESDSCYQDCSMRIFSHK